RRSIAAAPDQSLGCGRHKLAMLSQVASVRGEKDDGAIESAAGTLDHSHDEVQRIVPRYSSEVVHFRAGNLDRAVPVVPKLLAPARRTGTNAGAKSQATRIAGDEGFGKQRQCGAAAAGVRGKVCGLPESASHVEGHGGRLDDCNPMLCKLSQLGTS